jgi:predicted PurR-regulated permease PerM
VETNRTSNLIAADVDPAVAAEKQAIQIGPAMVAKTSLIPIVLAVLGTIGFLYFARSVVFPIFLAIVAGTALKPLIRWLSCCHMPPTLSATVVMGCHFKIADYIAWP